MHLLHIHTRRRKRREEDGGGEGEEWLKLCMKMLTCVQLMSTGALNNIQCLHSQKEAICWVKLAITELARIIITVVCHFFALLTSFYMKIYNFMQRFACVWFVWVIMQKIFFSLSNCGSSRRRMEKKDN